MRTFILATLVGAAVVLPVAAQNPQIQINKDNRTISVTTDATASAPAEIATVHIGFIVYAPDEQSAYSQGAVRSNAIAKALADAGVQKDDIQSENQNVAPVQPFENNNLSDKDKALRQFHVSQSWGVKTSADSAAKVLHVAVLAGANQSGGIDWTVKDQDALQAQAATKALAQGKALASTMAAGLNVKLGALVYASNQAPQQQSPVMAARAMSVQTVEVSAEPLSISPQKVQKSATVYAVFAIE